MNFLVLFGSSILVLCWFYAPKKALFEAYLVSNLQRRARLCLVYIKMIDLRKLFSRTKEAVSAKIKVIHCKNITLTYHNLPQDINVKQLILENVMLSLQRKLHDYHKDLLVENIVFTKEPYNYDKYPKQQGLVHIHGLITLNKKLYIRSPNKIAKIFSFIYKDKQYYPHVSALSNYKGYINYITKYQQENPDKFSNEEYYFNLQNDTVHHNIEDDLNYVLQNISKISPYEYNKILEKYKARDILKHHKTITLLRSLMQTNKEKLEDLFYKGIYLKFQHQDYIDDNDKDYKLILDVIRAMIGSRNKQSVIFHGPANTGKGSKVRAALSHIEEEKLSVGKTYNFIVIKHLEELSTMNFKEFQNYDNVCLVFDDVSYAEKDVYNDPDVIKNLLEGPEGESTLRCLYGIFKFPKNVRKIFIMNDSIYRKFIELSKKHEGIKERIIAYDIKNRHYPT